MLKWLFAAIIFPAMAFCVVILGVAIMTLAELVGIILAPMPVFYMVGVVMTYILLREITE